MDIENHNLAKDLKALGKAYMRVTEHLHIAIELLSEKEFEMYLDQTGAWDELQRRLRHRKKRR